MSDWIAWLPESGWLRLACDAAWQSTVILLAAAVALCLVRRPARRARVVLIAAGLCCAAPVLSAMARHHGWGLLSQRALSAPPQLAAWPAASDMELAADGDDVAVGVSSSRELADQGPRPGSANQLGSPSAASEQAKHAVVLPRWLTDPWTLAALAWLAATSALGVRLAKSAVELLSLCRHAEACVDETILLCTRRAAHATGLACPPRVVVSDRIGCPAVTAWPRPLLVIPPPDESPDEEQWFGVLAHELAHVQRGDPWARLLIELAVVLLPWQPLLWLLRREHHQAAEEACDDWVLSAGADPLDYATWLADWIPHRTGALAVGIRSWPGRVRRRILRLVESRTAPQPRLGRWWGAAAHATALSLLTAMALTQCSRTTPAVELAAAEPAGDSGPARGEPAPAVWAVQRVLGQPQMAHWSSARVLGFSHGSSDEFSDGGDTVVSCGLDGAVASWSCQTGERRSELAMPPSARGYRWWNWNDATRERYRTDELLGGGGRTLVYSLASGAIHLADRQTGQSRVVETPDSRPVKLAMSGDQKRLAVMHLAAAQSAQRVDILDLASGAVIRTVLNTSSDAAARSAVWRSMALSPDGRLLAAGASGTVAVWNLDSPDAAPWNVYGHGDQNSRRVVWATQFSPDSRMLVSGGAGGVVNVYSAETGQVLKTWKMHSTIRAVAVSPDGASVAAAGADWVSIWNIATGRQQWETRFGRGASTTIQSLAFSDDGTRLAASSGHHVEVIDTKTGRSAIDHRDRIACIAAHPLTGMLVAAHGDGLSIWSPSDGARRHWADSEVAISQLVFSPDGSALACVGGQTVEIRDAVSGQVRHTLEPGGSVSRGLPARIGFVPDGSMLLTSTSPKEGVLWDIRTGRRVRALPLNDFLPLDPFVFDFDTRLVASSRQHPGTLAVWNWSKNQTEAALERITPRIGGRLQLAVSASGDQLAYGVRGNEIRVTALRQENSLDLTQGGGGRLHWLAFSPDGRQLAAAAEDGQVRVWNLASPASPKTVRIGPPRGVVQQLAFASDGRRLMALNGDGAITCCTLFGELASR